MSTDTVSMEDSTTLDNYAIIEENIKKILFVGVPKEIMEQVNSTYGASQGGMDGQAEDDDVDEETAMVLEYLT